MIDRSKYDEQDQYQVQKGMNDISTHMKQYRYPNSHEAIIEEFEDYLPELVRGLWDSEGSVKKDGRLTFTNQHEETILTFVNSVIEILSLEGDELYVNNRDNWTEVFIPFYYAEEFLECVDFTIERKRDKLQGLLDRKNPESRPEDNDLTHLDEYVND